MLCEIPVEIFPLIAQSIIINIENHYYIKSSRVY